MPTLRVCLFGEPRFTVEGREHRFEAPPRTLPLLAYLLLHRRAIVDRTTLAGTMWADATDEEARANLRRHLHYLKRALPAPEGADWLTVSARAVSWNPEADVWLDVAAFEEASRTSDSRSVAAELYAGDLFARCEDEWITYERERLRTMQLSNLTALLHAAREARSYEDGMAYARRLLALDPWREDVVRSLMGLRAESGDRAGAIAEYDAFAARLRDEMAVEPMAETQAALEAIAIDVAPPAPAVTSTIVGREAELETVRRCWHAARQGTANLVFIGGESGVGKTTLLAAAADAAKREGADVYWGVAAMDRSAPYDVFADILRPMLRRVDNSVLKPETLRLIGTLLPDLPSVAASEAIAIGDESERLRLFGAIAESIDAASARGPLVLCLEDLHWSGESTAALLEYLLRRLARARVLFAATYREEDVSVGHPVRTLRRKLARVPTFAHIALSNLDVDSVRELAVGALGEARAHGVYQDLHARTGGNAFFVTELLRGAETSGEIELIPSVRQAVGERLARLSAPARTVVQCAAVLGRGFAVDVLSEITALAESDLLAALDEVTLRRIVRPAFGRESTEYVFAHAIMQSVAYDLTPAAWRTSTHARLARTLGGLADAEAAAVAHHAHRAGLPQAAHWYRVAAERALRVYAADEALRHAELAIELDRTGEEGYRALLIADEVYRLKANRARREDVLARLAAAVAQDDTDERRREVAVRRLDYCETIDARDAQEETVIELRRYSAAEPLWLGITEYWEAVLANRRGDVDRAFALAHDALERIGGRHPRYELSCYALLVSIAVSRGSAASSSLAKAHALLDAVGDPVMRGRVLWSQCRLLLQTDPKAALETAGQMLELARRTGDELLEAAAHRYLGSANAFLGRVDPAREHLAAAATMYAIHGTVVDEVSVLIWRAITEAGIGREDTSLAINAKALGLAERHDLIESQFHCLINIGIVRQQMRAFDAAAECYRRAERLIESAKLRGFTSAVRLNRAALYLETQRFAEAIAEIEAVLPHVRELEQRPSEELAFIELAVAYFGLGEHARAERCADIAWEAIRGRSDGGWNLHDRIWNLAWVFHMLGHADRAQGALLMAQAAAAQTLDSVSDEESREAFLGMAATRAIKAALERDEWIPYIEIGVADSACAPNAAL